MGKVFLIRLIKKYPPLSYVRIRFHTCLSTSQLIEIMKTIIQQFIEKYPVVLDLLRKCFPFSEIVSNTSFTIDCYPLSA